MTTTKINVTPAFAAAVAAVVAAGKTPWLIVQENYAVGPFNGRNEARAAKVADKLAGIVIKAADCEVTVVELNAPAKTKKDKPAKVAAPVDLTPQQQAQLDEKTNPINCAVCPKCGSTEIYHGVVDAKTGFVIDEDCRGGCHHCDWEFNFAILRKSEIESPCFIVWDTADKMVGARRKDVIAACVEKRVAFYTARTQYQLWLTSKRADEATKAKAKAHKGGK